MPSNPVVPTSPGLPGVSDEWLRLLDVNPDALTITDGAGRIVFVNEAAERLFRQPRSGLLGTRSGAGWRLVDEHGRPLEGDAFPCVRVRRTGRPERDVEVGLERADGTRAILSCAVAPLSDVGAGGGAITTARDVTAWRRAEVRQRLLAEAARALGAALDGDRVLQGIAHALVPAFAEACDVFLYDAGRLRHVLTVRLEAGAPRLLPAGATSVPAPAVETLTGGNASYLEAADTGATLGVSLVARGEPLGALVLTTYSGGWDEDDRIFAEDIAQRVALTLDNARLYRAARRTIDAAAARHAQAADILESIGDAFFAVDTDGRFTYVNAHAEKVLGFRREELIGRVAWDAVPRTLGPRIVDEMRRAAADRERRVFELASAGRERWVEVHIYPTPAGLSVYVHDITSRRQAAEAQSLLMDVGTALAATLDYEETLRVAARVAVPRLADFCTLDLVAEGDAIQRVAVAAADAATERKLRRLGRRHQPDPRLPSTTLHAIRTGESVLAAGLSGGALLAGVPDPDLLRMVQEVGVRAALTVPVGARGRRLGVMTFAYTRSGRSFTADTVRLAEDVARRVAIAIDNARLFEEAQESSRAKSNFISVMSHEFRTPLTAIVGYTDLLFAGVAGPLTEKQRAQLGRIKQSAWHLTQLIEEVLTFSRVDAGREKVSREPVDMAEIAAKAAALIEPVAHEKNLRLRVSIPSRPLVGQSDPGKVRQVLLNLLSNAVKFTDRGEVRLSVREADNRFVFEVSDTGVGIAEEHRQRIFDSFWQVEQGPTRTAGGTGLGLTISRRLAHLLGGDIDVTSQLGRGSTFTVWLPAPEQAPPQMAGPRGTVAAGGGR